MEATYYLDKKMFYFNFAEDTRNDRKIENYFEKVCESQNEIAYHFDETSPNIHIIELKDSEIGSLKKERSTKDKIIGKLQTLLFLI